MKAMEKGRDASTLSITAQADQIKQVMTLVVADNDERQTLGEEVKSITNIPIIELPTLESEMRHNQEKTRQLQVILMIILAI